MKQFSIVLAVMIGASVHVLSQTPVFDLERTTAGRVDLVQSNYGICGFDVGKNRGGLIYPRTNGWQYLFASGMWFGGWVRVGEELQPRVLVTYEVMNGAGCAVPGELKNGREPRIDLAEQYQVHRDIGGGIEVLSSRYHLGDTTRYQGAGLQLIKGLSDIEIREWTYAFDDDELADVIIRRFEYINTGDDTIYAFVPAWVLDPDVGDPANPQQASTGDRHSIMQIDEKTVYYIARDDDGTKTGELGFVVLESPLDGRIRTLIDGMSFISAFGHRERYEKMNNGELFADLGAYEVHALYAMSAVDVFAPGDTLRYTTAFVLMSPDERKQRYASGGGAYKQYYADAATRIRTLLADLPTSVSDEASTNESLIITPHPVTDHWTIRAPAGTPWNIAIYGLDGQLIHRTTVDEDGTAPGPDLPLGVYYIIASSGEQQITRAIVRQP